MNSQEYYRDCFDNFLWGFLYEFLLRIPSRMAPGAPSGNYVGITLRIQQGFLQKFLLLFPQIHRIFKDSYTIYLMNLSRNFSSDFSWDSSKDFPWNTSINSIRTALRIPIMERFLQKFLLKFIQTFLQGYVQEFLEGFLLFLWRFLWKFFQRFSQVYRYEFPKVLR